MLIRHHRSVAQPFADDVSGIVLFEFRLPAGTEVLERFWPHVHASTCNNILERGTEVLVFLSSEHRYDPCRFVIAFAFVRHEKGFIKRLPQFWKQ